jgi:hypothetical protein
MFLILEPMGQQLMVVIILVLILSLKSTDNLAINSTNCIPNVNLNISIFLPMTHSNGILMTTQLANSNSYTQLNQVIIK